MNLFTISRPNLLTAARVPRRSGARAFTLVEVMVAVLITVVMFGTFYSAITSGVVTIQGARENLRATQIMVNRMEGIRLFTFEQLADTSLLPRNFTESYYANDTNGNPGITYTGVVSVAPAALSNPSSSYSTNMYKVTVEVSWQSVGPVQTRQMSTYCAKWGVQNYVWSSN